MSIRIRKQLRDISCARINAIYPVGSCMRDKQTGDIYVRGASVQGGKFAVMSTGANPQRLFVSCSLFELRFEPEVDRA